ncbi:hypothetical protein N7G274_001890 [Stereocaulon virgatum]|uniref:Uncharacterized protein n=1 Tax=Stereocaulon virgatum TaxID=373712 RepID=A0ABR4AMV2_9LECA
MTQASKDPTFCDFDVIIPDEDLDPMLRDDYDPTYCVSNGLPSWYTRPVPLNRIPPLLAFDELLGSAPPAKDFEQIFNQADEALDRFNISNTESGDLSYAQARRFLGPHQHLLIEVPRNNLIHTYPEGPINYRYREEHFRTPTRHQTGNIAAQTSQHHTPGALIHVDGDTAMLHNLQHRRELTAPTPQIQVRRQQQNPRGHPPQPQVKARRILEHIVTDLSKSEGRVSAIEPNSDHNPNNPYMFPSLQTYSIDPPPHLYWCREINGGYSLRNLDEIEHQLQPGYWAETRNKRPFFVRTRVEVEEQPGKCFKSLERLRAYMCRR